MVRAVGSQITREKRCICEMQDGKTVCKGELLVVIEINEAGKVGADENLVMCGRWGGVVKYRDVSYLIDLIHFTINPPNLDTTPRIRISGME